MLALGAISSVLGSADAALCTGVATPGTSAGFAFASVHEVLVNFTEKPAVRRFNITKDGTGRDLLWKPWPVAEKWRWNPA